MTRPVLAAAMASRSCQRRKACHQDLGVIFHRGVSTSSESRASKLERVVQQLQFLKMALPESTENKSPKSQSHVPAQTETRVQSNFDRMKAYLDRQKVQKAKQAAMTTKNESHNVDGSKQIPRTSEKINMFCHLLFLD